MKAALDAEKYDQAYIFILPAPVKPPIVLNISSNLALPADPLDHSGYK